MKANNEKVLLIILDGWGIKESYEGNAIVKANTPFNDRLWHDYPRAILNVSGESVGLPNGQMGTSEVNHFTIGTGRIAYQDLVRINKAVQEGHFAENEVFVQAFEHVKTHGSTLHIKGLLSPGGVHSHQDHIYELLKAARDLKLQRKRLRMLMPTRRPMNILSRPTLKSNREKKGALARMMR